MISFRYPSWLKSRVRTRSSLTSRMQASTTAASCSSLRATTFPLTSIWNSSKGSTKSSLRISDTALQGRSALFPRWIRTIEWIHSDCARPQSENAREYLPENQHEDGRSELLAPRAPGTVQDGLYRVGFFLMITSFFILLRSLKYSAFFPHFQIQFSFFI